MSKKNPTIFVHSQGRYFSKTILMAGFVMIMTPAILALYDILWPIIFVPLGIGILLPIKQFEIDLTRNYCRDSINFLGYRYGKWVDVSAALAITLSKKRYTWLRSTGYAAMDSVEDEFFVVIAKFYFSPTQRYEIDEFDNKNEALKVCGAMANKMGIKLFDATVKPPVRLL